MKRVCQVLVFAGCVLAAAAGAKERDAAYFIDVIAQNRALAYDEVRAIRDAAVFRLMRNAVYARNGYVFTDKSLTSYFSKFKWYKPAYRNVDDRLSPNDRNNLEIVIFFENGIRFNALVKKDFRGYSSAPGAEEKGFVGIWQNAPIMASGWSDTYAFYANRKIVKRGNQMDCEKRELWKIGNWRIEKGTLSIEYFAVGRMEGGRLVEAAGSCGTDNELVDATYVIVDLTPVEREEIPVSAIETRKDADVSRKSVMIGETRFWLMGTNPDEY